MVAKEFGDYKQIPIRKIIWKLQQNRSLYAQTIILLL